MTPPLTAGDPEAGAADWLLTRRLRRWRSAFLAATLLTTALVVVDFIAGRTATRRLAESSTILRKATAAQALAWSGESAIRHFALQAGSVGAEGPQRALTARDRTLEALADLEGLTASDPVQRARLDSLTVALRYWDATFVAPIVAGEPLSRPLAQAATTAFDDVARHFDLFIEAQALQRLSNLRVLNLVSLAGTAVVLLSLLVIVASFSQVSRRVVREAELARLQQARLEEQAAEMEQQAQQLEHQASTLEEQTRELEQRVAERDATNHLLEQTAAYLDSAVESAPMGVAFLDRELRFVRVNEAFALLHDASPATHVGHAVAEIAPGLAPSVTPMLSRVLRTGAAETDEAVVVPLAGAPAARTARQLRVSCYPLRARGRPPIGVGVMVLDVTERMQLEEQLRQSQKMEAVGRLAGGIAHDFNNVLTIIQSYAELLAAELAQGTPGHEEVRAIRGAADRAAALARQLLAFSRREVVIPRVIDLNEVIRGMQGMFERLLRQGVKLRLEVGDEPRLVRADAGQVEQVLLNLAINAVDAMPDGGELHITTSTRSGESLPDRTGDCEAVVVTVRDTGTGMTREVQQRLFEPFFTTKPSGLGTGLGLATAYAIVRAADGVIRVESEPGRGSCFDVIFPRRAEAEREHGARPSPRLGLPAAPGGETILLVEDEPAIRQALARVLSANGYRVIEASNGGEALRRAEEEKGTIDLMLTDVMMPGLGGKELAQRLLVTRPGTRVILMSGYTDDDLLRQELGDARYVFLQKPFAARQAVAAVRQLLDTD